MTQAPLPRPELPRALRWTTASASGQAVDRPCRLYCARLVGLVAGSQDLAAGLHDDASGDHAGPLLLGLTVVGGVPDDWPSVPVSLPFLRGIDVEMTGASTVLLVLGWDVD